MTDQYFVDQFKVNCINTHEKIEHAKEVEATLKEVKAKAEDLVHEVDIVGRQTQHSEDELLVTNQLIAQAEAKVQAFNNVTTKTNKILSELNSRLLNVENEIGKGKATLEDKNAKIEAHNDFIHQERQERKVDDKLLYDNELKYDGQEKELLKAIQSAEDYTIKYEEVKARIRTLEQVLRKQVDRGDKAEEKVQQMETLLAEKLVLQNEMNDQSIENSANEDNLLEDVRQKREALYNMEQRLAFAAGKRDEYQAVANDLNSKFIEEQKTFESLKK